MRRRPGPALIAVALAATVFVASIALPALGAPHAYTAASVASKVKKALGLAKAADVDSKRAMRAAERFGKGPAGPQGGQGEPGSPGEAGAGGLPGGSAGNGSSGAVGTSGAAGDAGDDAGDGAPGFDGIPRKTTPSLETTPTPTQFAITPNLVEIPLSDASWTQGDFETDMVFASLTLSNPDIPNCDSTGSGFPPAAIFNLRLDSASGAILLTGVALPDDTQVVLHPPFNNTPGPAQIFEPGGTNSERSLYLEAGDTCSDDGNLEIDDVNIAVVGMNQEPAP